MVAFAEVVSKFLWPTKKVVFKKKSDRCEDRSNAFQKAAHMLENYFSLQM